MHNTKDERYNWLKALSHFKLYYYALFRIKSRVSAFTNRNSSATSTNFQHIMWLPTNTLGWKQKPKKQSHYTVAVDTLGFLSIFKNKCKGCNWFTINLIHVVIVGKMARAAVAQTKPFFLAWAESVCAHVMNGSFRRGLNLCHIYQASLRVPN